MAGRTQLAPTFVDILQDSITKVAEVYWAPYNLNKKPFDIKGKFSISMQNVICVAIFALAYFFRELQPARETPVSDKSSKSLGLCSPVTIESKLSCRICNARVLSGMSLLHQ